MKIGITGGTGFVGRHLARALVRDGHEVVLVARGRRRPELGLRELPGVHFTFAEIDDEAALLRAFSGCDVVAHCAGINREIGEQTYERVHVLGTRAVVVAARRAGVRKVTCLSFLRARPDCGLAYHESKWAAEEIVRQSGLDFTILKAGIIYGQGDHLLDHLSHALHTFPIFGLIGGHDMRVAPVAVEDLVTILEATLVGDELSRESVAVVGPEALPFRDVVRRVAGVLGKAPGFLPLPVAGLLVLAWFWERLMKVPLVSIAQVRILSEGAAEPLPGTSSLPTTLAPWRTFSPPQIREGLPAAEPFALTDLRCCS
jgi:uncharacterized protein YbjT (DUF2867 family)